MLMKNKRKPLIITLICLAVIVVAAAGVWFFWLKDYLAASSAAPVYVNPISSIVGLDTGSNPRYSGIVEPQQTYKINKDESKTVAEVLVSEGDEVHAGDVLFRYDTEEMQFSLKQAQIDQEGIANRITTLKTQLSTLKTEKSKASKDEQPAYTLQIQSVELDIRNQEYESSKKKSEIEKLQTSLANADVLSEVEGVVKEINTTGQTDAYGQQKPFISVLSVGEYRVKGTISELNISSLSPGQAVTVHSRIDPEQVWTGVVDSIDQEATADQNSNMGYYYAGMDTGERSSKYNFYVVLDNLDGLILGQHVYIEPDLGENAKKDGLWLPAMYIGHDESGSFVWAKNDKDKLEKRMVILGDYDSANDMYQIKSGVTRVDSIAYPSDELKSGMPTTMDASLQGAYMSGSDNTADSGMFGGADSGMTDSYPDGMGVPEGGSDLAGEAVPEDGGYADGFDAEYLDDSDGGSASYDDGSSSSEEGLVG